MMPRQGKQSMADLKLRRLTEYNARLKEDHDRPRIKISEASQSLMRFCSQTRDFLVPSIWGPVDKTADPYVSQSGAGGGGGGGCCTVM